MCCGGINDLGSVSWVCGECVRLCGVAGGGLVGGGTGWGLGKLETGPHNGSFWDETVRTLIWRYVRKNLERT